MSREFKIGELVTVLANPFGMSAYFPEFGGFAVLRPGATVRVDDLSAHHIFYRAGYGHCIKYLAKVDVE